MRVTPKSGVYRAEGIVEFLRNLTIFETFNVPLFIDNYGKKRLMSDYEDLYEDIDIDLDTQIVHVTHSKEKDQIVENQLFVPSNNKNIIEGVWFSPESQLGDPPHSVYGSWAFKTTLRSLGVRWLRQGEIVSYKNEVNFILYASDTVSPNPVRKATDEKLTESNPEAYAAVSIFVPSRFLPQDAAFGDAFGEPDDVSHQPFCVKVKRNVIAHCDDLKPAAHESNLLS